MDPRRYAGMMAGQRLARIPAEGGVEFAHGPAADDGEQGPDDEPHELERQGRGRCERGRCERGRRRQRSASSTQRRLRQDPDGRGVPVVDAQFLVRDARGFAARDVEHDGLLRPVHR